MSSQQRLAGGGEQTIHIFHHTFRRGGGKERYAIALASSLKALGKHVVFHASRADQDLADTLGIKLNLVPVSPFPRKLQDFRFFRQIDRVRAEFDGLHISLSRLRVKDILVSGGTHRGYLARARKWTGPFDLLQLWMEHQAYRHVRTIVAHSDLLAHDLIHFYGLPREKIHTLYPPVDDRFSTLAPPIPRTQIRQKLGWPPDKVVFLFPSSGHSRKGLAPICEALKAFSGQALLAVAGKPPAGSKWPFLQFLGYLEDMALAYRAADFTILGSSYEPFGLVGPESIVCGTRLVFEENIGCLSAVKPEFVLTFSVWNLPSIRQAIAQAIELARQGQHHFDQPLHALRYDPSPLKHALAVLQAAAYNQ